MNLDTGDPFSIYASEIDFSQTESTIMASILSKKVPVAVAWR